MANPNIINIASLYAKTALLDVTTTPTVIVENPAASNKLFKITTIYLSNKDTVVSVNATLEIYRNSVSYYIMFQTPVPVSSTIDVLAKNIYLQRIKRTIYMDRYCNFIIWVGFSFRNSHVNS
jgi:hypothetical protein